MCPPPPPRLSPMSLSRCPGARLLARKQTLALRQTAPPPPRRQFLRVTLMAGGSTDTVVATPTICRELAKPQGGGTTQDISVPPPPSHRGAPGTLPVPWSPRGETEARSRRCPPRRDPPSTWWGGLGGPRSAPPQPQGSWGGFGEGFWGGVPGVPPGLTAAARPPPAPPRPGPAARRRPGRGGRRGCARNIAAAPPRPTPPPRCAAGRGESSPSGGFSAGSYRVVPAPRRHRGEVLGRGDPQIEPRHG